MDLSSLVAGLVAYAVSVLASVVLVFLTYRVNTFLTSKIDEEKLLLAGGPPPSPWGPSCWVRRCSCATPSFPRWP